MAILHAARPGRRAVSRRYEINISTATLDRPIEETTATLCHECAHLYALTHGIKDTSGAGNSYHNKRFKAIAEAHGLVIDHHAKYGWTITSPSLELLDFIEAQAGKLSRCPRA